MTKGIKKPAKKAVQEEEKEEKAAPTKAAVLWIGTKNNPVGGDEEHKAYLEQWVTAGPAVYVLGQLEVGEKGTPHLQFYIHLSGKGQRMTALSKIDKACHYTAIAVDRGARKYCMKEATRKSGPWEFGTLPLRRNEPEDWNNAYELAKEGRLEEIDKTMLARHYGNFKAIERDHYKGGGWTDTCKGIWYHGPPGSGKSKLAHELYPNAYQKAINQWWCGYQGQLEVIVDDMDLHLDKKLIKLVKDWGDRYHRSGEIKGGIVALKFTKIIVTSQYAIEEVFPDAQDLLAMKRRFFTVVFTNNYGDESTEAELVLRKGSHLQEINDHRAEQAAEKEKKKEAEREARQLQE